MGKSVSTAVFLQVEPELTYWAKREPSRRDQPESIEGAKVVGFTLRKPSKPKPGSVVVKIQLELPVGVFLALAPEATVVVPESFATPTPIVVEATDANGVDE